MRLNRFFINFDFFNFSKKIIKIFDREIYNQIKNVLRMNIGDRVILCDNKLNEILVKIKNINKNFIEFEIESIYKNKNESLIYSILYCSILKKGNFEIVVQKATETGIKEIVPIIAKRTIKINFQKERLKKIIKEAAEQSYRGLLPILDKPIKFEDALNLAKKNDLNLFFDLTGISFSQFLKNLKLKNQKKIGIFIGPEGGWTDEELEIAKKNDFVIINLGNFTLRAETAAIIASYLVNSFKLNGL